MPARHPIVDFEPWDSMNVHKLYIDNFSLTVSILRIMYKGRDVQNIVNNLIDKVSTRILSCNIFYVTAQFLNYLKVLILFKNILLI